VRGFLVAALLCAPALLAQDEPPPFEVRPAGIFNQHLYAGSFVHPRGLAFDREHDELWIADSTSGIVSVFRPDGAELYSFSSKKYLRQPARVAIAPHDQIAVIDGDHAHVRLFDYRGNYKGDVAMPGLGEKPIVGAVAYDDAGTLYVGENRSGQIFVYSAEGKLKMQFGSKGADEGQFTSISAIALDAGRNVYVADQRGLAVQVFDGQGNFMRGWGRHEMGAANFSLPSGIAVDDKGRVFVADELRHQVKIFSTEGKYLGQFGGLGDRIGELSFPTDIAADAHGRVYVSERTTARVQVFEIR
jgi:DNA-binding beta-propeller fold protein YncE